MYDSGNLLSRGKKQSASISCKYILSNDDDDDDDDDDDVDIVI